MSRWPSACIAGHGERICHGPDRRDRPACGNTFEPGEGRRRIGARTDLPLRRKRHRAGARPRDRRLRNRVSFSTGRWRPSAEDPGNDRPLSLAGQERAPQVGSGRLADGDRSRASMRGSSKATWLPGSAMTRSRPGMPRRVRPTAGSSMPVGGPKGWSGLWEAGQGRVLIVTSNGAAR